MNNKNYFYEFWLNDYHINQCLKKQMLEMTIDDINASFSEKPIAFGTAGYRAKMGPGMLYLNEFTYQQLTIAYAKLILDSSNNSKPTILVAHDNRINGLKYANLIGAILSSMGIKVLFNENNLPIPTPMVSYIVRKLNLDGAINITASHNPKEYNGFKVFDNKGCQLNSLQVQQLKNHISSWKQNLSLKINPNLNNFSYLNDEIINDYFNDVLNHINLNKLDKDDEPIIFVSHHGTASWLKVINFLKSNGHNIVPVYTQSYINESFENSVCINPEDEKSFKSAIELADYYQSNLIIGLDPDGDRLAIVIRHNQKWVYLNGNENGILATYYLLKYKDFKDTIPTIASTYVSNNLINKIASAANALVLRSAVGFKNIATLINQIQVDKRMSFVVGFEEAVGLCISDNIREKDGIAASLLMIEIYKFYKQQNISLIDLLNDYIYPKFGNWIGKTISFKINGIDWKDKVNSLMEKIKNTNLKQIGDFKLKSINWNEEAQCMEFYLDDNQSWIKFRASGTEPKFKIYYNLYFNNEQYLSKNGYELKNKALIEINNQLIEEFGVK